jgi:hypothetical protein
MHLIAAKTMLPIAQARDDQRSDLRHTQIQRTGHGPVENSIEGHE